MTGDSETGFRWFYVQEGRRKGPLALPELVALILGGEVPEDTLIWHAGLAEWVKANSVEEIQRELPPPIPGKEADQPDDVPAQSRERTQAEELDEAETEEAEPDETEPSESGTGGGSAKPGGSRRRRHRPWLAPLIVMLIVVVFVLWYLLRRFNEVPHGQVIFQGALSEVGRPVEAPSCPARPFA